MARVKANIRRVDMAPAQSAPPAGETEKRLELGRVSIDLDGATVFKDGKPLELTQREYELIRFLASQPGKVFSREALMEHVWNYEGLCGRRAGRGCGRPPPAGEAGGATLPRPNSS